MLVLPPDQPTLTSPSQCGFFSLDLKLGVCNQPLPKHIHCCINFSVKNIFEYFRLTALLKNSTRFRSSRERWRWCWGGCWISIIFFYFLFPGAPPERYCYSVLAVSNYYQSQVNQDQAKVCKVPVYYLQHLFKALVFVYL